MDNNIVEKVTKVLKEVKDLEAKIKNLKDLNRDDRQAVINYMRENKKQFLGNLQLKLYKNNYYLALVDDNLFGE